MIAYYNVQVARLNLQLDGYKTDTQVFETEVRAAVETVSVYRAQLEAARVQGEIDRNRIEIFRSQVAGVEALIGIYKTTVAAARVKADIESVRCLGNLPAANTRNATSSCSFGAILRDENTPEA